MSTIFCAESNAPLTFKYCFNILKEQINEFNFVFTKDGIKIQEHNPIKNTDIDIFLRADTFQKYDLRTKDPIIIGVNIPNIFKIFKVITVKDSGIRFKVVESEDFNGHTRELSIEIINTKHSQTISVRCVKIDVNYNTNVNIDTSGYPVVIDINSQDFQEIINKLKNLGNKNSKDQDTIIYYDGHVLNFIIDEGEFGTPSVISKEYKGAPSTDTSSDADAEGGSEPGSDAGSEAEGGSEDAGSEAGGDEGGSEDAEGGSEPGSDADAEGDESGNDANGVADVEPGTSDQMVMYSISVKLYKLMELMRCTSLTPNVIMYIGNGMPLIIHYSVGILGDMKIRLN